MVTTRHSARLATKQADLAINNSNRSSAGNTMAKKDATKKEDEEPLAKETTETGKNSLGKEEESVQSTHTQPCPHYKEEVQDESGVVGGLTLKGYLKGFGKRVVFCTLLVMVCKSVWPQIQPIVWPEAPTKEGKVYVLSDKSFRGHVKTGHHIVMMYAPWCGHCQKLKPVWDQLAKTPGVEGVVINKVDCTANTKTCKDYDVSGYPTILFFKNGKMVEKYTGNHSLPGLHSFLRKMVSAEVDGEIPSPPPIKKQKKKTKKEKKEL